MSQHTELIDELRKSSASDSAWNLGILCQRAADALQAMERVPMTDAQAHQMYRSLHRIHGNCLSPEGLVIVRATEAHHDITPPESI